jgi:hypothetical protein
MYWHYHHLIGAKLGGKTNPLSSECVITSAPIKRVETPHEVPQTYVYPQH